MSPDENDVQWLRCLSAVPVPWASGAALANAPADLADGEPLGGALARAPRGEDPRALAEAIAKLLSAAAPTAAGLQEVQAALEGTDLDAAFEALVAELSRQLGPEASRVVSLGRWCAQCSSQLDWAKLGLGLVVLGLSEADSEPELERGSELRALALRLGRHASLTVFAALVIQQLDPRASALVELAEVASGWGRAWLVDQLCGAADHEPVIGAWLLAHGADPQPESASQALAIAQASEPASLLTKLTPADAAPMLRGASHLLDALLVGDESADIDDYDAAAAFALSFMRCVEAGICAAGPLEYCVTARVARLLDEGAELAADAASVGVEADVEFLWAQRAQQSGWTPDLRSQLGDVCTRVLSSPGARACVERTLPSACPRLEFERALVVAEGIGIDALPFVLDRLGSEPSWVELWERVSATPSAALWALARASLPLEQIATGAALDYDFDEATQVHDALASVVAAGLQGDAIANEDLRALWLAAAASPLVRVRAQVIDALEAIGNLVASRHGEAAAGRVPLVAAGRLTELASQEPEESLAASLRKLAAASA